jgi:hypothetical protein
MKVLVFPGIKPYEMLYEGLLTTSTKGAETRTLAKILTKLEKVGTRKLNAKGEESLLYTVAELPIIKFEDAELDFIKRRINEVEWSGPGAKDAGALLEWLDEKHPSEEEYNKQQEKSTEEKTPLKVEK